MMVQEMAHDSTVRMYQLGVAGFGVRPKERSQAS